MRINRLSLTDWRNYESADIEFGAGANVLAGSNGQGKTNLLEAVAYLAGSSLRGATTESMVRTGADRAVVRLVLTT